MAKDNDKRANDVAEQLERLGQSADEVGGMHPIEHSDVVGKIHRVALGKTHPLEVDAFRRACLERSGDMPLFQSVIGNASARCQSSGRPDEAAGKVDTQDLLRCSGQLEA